MWNMLLPILYALVLGGYLYVLLAETKAQASPVHLLPVDKRGGITLENRVRGLVVAVFLLSGGILISSLQIMSLGLKYTGLTHAYKKCIAGTKEMFTDFVALLTQLFAPSKIVLTSGSPEITVTEGKLHAPFDAVWMSNHQTFADWLYMWNLMTWADAARTMTIVLKASIKKVPVFGWGCIFFDFIFLKRRWSEDRSTYLTSLKELGKRSLQERARLAFLIFPEGALVSEEKMRDTEAYAAKTGAEKFEFLLIPRVVGLFVALRVLAQSHPNMSVVDTTMGFERGREGYTKDYYDLKSIFVEGVAPPAVHMHVRSYALADIPLGGPGEGDAYTPEELLAFTAWLTARWREKDALLRTFRDKGRFVDGPSYEWSIGLRKGVCQASALAYSLPFFLAVYLVLGR